MSNGRGASRLRFRLLPTVLLTLAILLLPTAIYAWGRTSSSFAIEKVVVTGAEHAAKPRLLRVLRRDHLGRNLFTVTSEDASKSLARFSYIATATVDRDFPTTLRVAVREHEPVAYVYAAGKWYTVSDEGHVITRAGKANDGGGAGAGEAVAERDAQSSDAAGPAAQSAPPADIVTAVETEGADATGDAGNPTEGESDGAHASEILKAGPSKADLKLPRLEAEGSLEPGRCVEDPEALLAVDVIAGLPKALRKRLDYVTVSDDEVMLHYSSGLEVVWGNSERALAKTIAFRTVLKRYEASDTTCTFVDVSAPDRVLARPILE